MLGEYFLRGIEINSQGLEDLLLRRPYSDWPRFVKRSWLAPYLENTEKVAFGHTILWRVICYELWCRRLAGQTWAGRQ